MRRIAPALALAFLGACSPGEENLAIVANAPTSLATGPEQRMLIGLVDPETGASLAVPEREVTVTLTGPNQEQAELEAEFLWTIENVRGLYLARYQFPTAGAWTVRLHPADLGPTPPTPFQVDEQAGVPEVGTPAPAVASRTSADFPLNQISSDPDPDPAFYDVSLDEAIGSGQPTVVVFASPAFCQSQTCGPMLDQVKAASSSYPDINFVHVEIYENLDAASPADLRLVPAVAAWGLPSEPWIFMIDREGMVAARFEGAISPQELTTSLEGLAAP